MAFHRDARPFVAHHLRRRADERSGLQGADLHALARWVENLSVADTRMARIAGTDALGYEDGSFEAGPAGEAEIAAWVVSNDPMACDRWLDRFAAAVEAND